MCRTGAGAAGKTFLDNDSDSDPICTLRSGLYAPHTHARYGVPYCSLGRVLVTDNPCPIWPESRNGRWFVRGAVTVDSARAGMRFLLPAKCRNGRGMRISSRTNLISVQCIASWRPLSYYVRPSFYLSSTEVFPRFASRQKLLLKHPTAEGTTPENWICGVGSRSLRHTGCGVS